MPVIRFSQPEAKPAQGLANERDGGLAIQDQVSCRATRNLNGREHVRRSMV